MSGCDPTGRLVRITAADRFEALIEHLTDTARKYAESVDKAIAAATPAAEPVEGEGTKRQKR